METSHLRAPVSEPSVCMAAPSDTAAFFRGKRVFVTGHTGFKGSWLCHILKRSGAQVTGYALKPPTDPSLFALAQVADGMVSVEGDIRDDAALLRAVREAQPEFVFHLAAQPLVLDGYERPAYTYETNVMGTVHLLEAVRSQPSIRSVVNVTTDKVYLNIERAGYAYAEDDRLDGYDPYSNSKSCSELVTHSYAKSFLSPAGVAVSTVRAGNVIGGGDFSANRIVPDCIRAAATDEPLVVRNPYSTRPYQHVLEPLFAYLSLARAQRLDAAFADSYNVGPDEADCVTTGRLADLFAQAWGSGFRWVNGAKRVDGPHEANYLKLDSSKLKHTLGWAPRWHIADAVEATVEWAHVWLDGGDIRREMDVQIERYCS